MDLSTLTKVEIEILKNFNTDWNNLKKHISIDETSLQRGIQWLSNKGLIELKYKETNLVDLDINGEKAKKEGLPEEILLKSLKDGKEKKENEIPLSKEEIMASIGVLKKNSAVDIRNEKGLLLFKITKFGENMLKIGFKERDFLNILPKELEKLSESEKWLLDIFKNRKNFIKIKKSNLPVYKLTNEGVIVSEKISKQKLEFEERLTKEDITSKKWVNKSYRKYDVVSKTPKLVGGKKHFYKEFQNWVRNQFISMGFEEMSGPIIESEFWDMDALYMPQFHSARDIHDAYYLENVKKISIKKEILEKVKKMHEEGDNESKGWKYKFDENKTQNPILRTQGTALSARQLTNAKIPAKYFAISKCFRHDVIDATHLSDFYQVEGIVLGKELTFAHLKNLLREFAEVFAESKEIEIVPGYFPFTEPSAELRVKHPELGWIELGGAGMFRHELREALGIKVPVLAWGLGIDRIGMSKMKINDIRELYSDDLNRLKEKWFIN